MTGLPFLMQALPAVFIITAPEAFVKQLFLKKSENKYLLVIPVSQLEGQVEFLVEYNGQYFDIITNRKGKAS